MAPSPGRRLGCVLLWLLAVLTTAQTDSNASASAGAACKSVDDLFDDALSGAPNASSPTVVTLGDACNTLERNHICVTVGRSFIVDGMANGGTLWDTKFSVFEFALATGVNVTLRNLQLGRALIFTSGYANMQPALFYLQPGARVIMQNVTIQTLCTANKFYWTQDAFVAQQPGGQPDTLDGRPLHITSLTVGSVTMQNVSLTCDAQLSAPTLVQLYVHSADQLTSYTAASSSLALPSTIHLMENITLPYIPSYNVDTPDARVAVIKQQVVIMGTSDADFLAMSSGSSGTGDNTTSSSGSYDTNSCNNVTRLTYIDANYTNAWFYVQAPAKLVLKGLVFTRLRTALIATGFTDGVLAGALPLFMVQSSAAATVAAATQQTRVVMNSTMLVPQYEVAEVSYWCRMATVLAPEFASVTDFMRSLVWESECDMEDVTRLRLQRVRSTTSLFAGVLLTSVPPPGVPYDANQTLPAGAAAYEHVQPPLLPVNTGAEWVDALAPVLPQDTWSSPPLTPNGGVSSPSSSPSAAISSSSAGSSSSNLPALVLLNGTVTVGPAEVRVPGGGQRRVRRSAVISAMRRSCGADGSCPVLDLGSMQDLMRLEGDNVTLLFQCIRLRNLSTALFSALTGTAAGSMQSWLVFDRSAVHVVYDNVTIELPPEKLAEVYRYLSAPDRASLPGNIQASFVSASYIQVVSFNLSGIRGTNVDLRLLPGTVPALVANQTTTKPSGSNTTTTTTNTTASSSSTVGAASGSTHSSPAAIIAGTCIGGVVAAFFVTLLVWLFVQRRRAVRRQAGVETPVVVKVGKAAADSSDEEVEVSRLKPPSKLSDPRVNGFLPMSSATAAAAAVAGSGGQFACQRNGLPDEENGHGYYTTTGTVSSATTASDGGLAQGGGGGVLSGLAVATGIPSPVPGSEHSAVPASSGAAGTGPATNRRAFSLACSVPEDNLLDIREDSDARPDRGASRTQCGDERDSATSASGGGGIDPGVRSGGELGVVTRQRYLRQPPVTVQQGQDSIEAIPSSDNAGELLDTLTGGTAISTASANAAAAASSSPATMRHRATSGGGGAAAASVSSSSSSHRVIRTQSHGRPHIVVLGDSGSRLSGLRVRARGRSPPRPTRPSLAAVSSCHPVSAVLPAPAPAVLAPTAPVTMTAELARRSALAGGSPLHCPQRLQRNSTTASGTSIRRVPRLCTRSSALGLAGYSNSNTGSGGGCGAARRERSQPTIVAPGPDLSCETEALAGSGQHAVRSPASGSPSVQLLVTGGGGGGVTLFDAQSNNFDGESCCSPGVSMSVSKAPEPASEVQRLISEMAAHGTDQLVILEPIGQGGYGTVFRGVWRNLDVAVKTVLFQDLRACLTPSPTPALGTAASLVEGGRLGGSNTTVVDVEEQGLRTRPPSYTGSPHPCLAPGVCLSPALGCQAAAGTATPTSSCAPNSGSTAGTGGVGGTLKHNWMLASQAANSGSLPTVNVVGAAPGAPPGVASQQRAVLEAAVSCSVAHPNVVATYHYDVTPVRPSAVMCSGGLMVSDGQQRAGGGGGPAGGGGGGGAGAGGGGVLPSDWKLYLVQEFCDGGSLATALDSRLFHDPAGMPNLAMTLCALADIARGMAHIHSRSVIHGDLNPTNILLRSINGSTGGVFPMWNRVGLTHAGAGGCGGAAGSGGAVGGGSSGGVTPGTASVSHAATLRQELGVGSVAKVADFGLCGMLAPGKRHVSNALRGTPFYTAPEMVATGMLTKASDVYSFGVIAWEVYNGRPPFRHLPDKGFVRDDSFPRLPPHVPPTFANMTLGCLNPDPDARPTFDQILDRLMSLQAKLAVSLQQRLSRLVGGNSAGFLAGAGAGAGGGAGSNLSSCISPGAAAAAAGGVLGLQHRSHTSSTSSPHASGVAASHRNAPSPHASLLAAPPAAAAAGAVTAPGGNYVAAVIPPAALLAATPSATGSALSANRGGGVGGGRGGNSGTGYGGAAGSFTSQSMSAMTPGLAAVQSGAVGGSSAMGPLGLPAGVTWAANSMPSLQPLMLTAALAQMQVQQQAQQQAQQQQGGSSPAGAGL